MSTAYFDCFGGASGDMIVGALLGAGVKLSALREELAKLDLHGYTIAAERVKRGGLAGTKFDVRLEAAEDGDHEHHHAHGDRRNLKDILDLLDRAGLDGRVDTCARRVFRRLADAEARAHGVSVDEVRFHEVGAIDSIVDIVAASVGLELLGVDRVLCSPIPLGSGTVRCAHGVMPVPAPGTAELMRDGAIAPSDFPAELCTPTGAAVLTTLAEEFTTLPPMAVTAIGYGAGQREDAGRVNMLRVFLGTVDPEGQADTAVELAANVDDTSGELVGAVFDMLMDAGALDAWAVPITMKKSRPAVRLGVLCRPADVARMEEILFRQTTTIGIRRHTCSRSKLSRLYVTAETRYGPVRVKVSSLGGTECSATAEFEDCARAAQAHHVPIKEVQTAAVEAYRQAGRDRQ